MRPCCTCSASTPVGWRFQAASVWKLITGSRCVRSWSKVRGNQIMLTLLGNPRRCCDGLNRRELLRVGALSLFGGLMRPGPIAATQPPPRRGSGKIRSVILLDLFGGPSHLDMFDPKPAAPVEIRGEFGPLATSLPGVQVSEH